MADTRVSIFVADDDGDRRAVPFFLAAAKTEAELQAFATAMCPLLDAVVDGQIVEVQYTKNLTMPAGLKANAVQYSEVQKGATFAFNNQSRYKYSMYVPVWQVDQFTGDEPIVGAGDGLAFINGIVAGAGGHQVTNGFGFDLESLAGAKKSFRK